MSGQHPPISFSDFKDILSTLGFKFKKQVGSHEQWIATFRGKYRKVTVDKNDAPFTGDVISSMANQAGVTKKEIYDVYFCRSERLSDH